MFDIIFNSNSTYLWTALGALSTTSACIIALWQTHYSNRKKICLNFYPNMYLMRGATQVKYISLEIVNTGNRKIIINEWNYLTNTKNERIKMFTELDSIIPVKLPQVIDIENKLDLYFDYSLFVNSLKRFLDDGRLKGNQKIIFTIRDSTGKTYKLKTKETVNDFVKSMELGNAK